jgi:hypothetical protein
MTMTMGYHSVFVGTVGEFVEIVLLVLGAIDAAVILFDMATSARVRLTESVERLLEAARRFLGLAH